jgi:hypothetical protein
MNLIYGGNRDRDNLLSLRLGALCNVLFRTADCFHRVLVHLANSRRSFTPTLRSFSALSAAA